jgi:hypothetical protein
MLAAVLGVLALAFVRPAAGAGTNRTLDDSASTGVTYAGKWNDGPQCPGCYVQPDPAQCQGRSWHDTTVGPDPNAADSASVSVSFSGACGGGDVGERT